MRKWFDKLIACAFYIGDDIVRRDLCGEYIFNGTYEHSDHDNRRDPLQYEFINANNGTSILLNYKQARQIMGAMIDNNK